jgi:hypothetical protein
MRIAKRVFLPDGSKRQKASGISPQAIFLYIVFFILLHLGFNIVIKFYPGVLGTSSAITIEELIRISNVQRTKNGLLPLVFNPALAAAASAKGQDMFANNYWAHVSPTGVDPWAWLKNSGYDYLYAGENLAKDFVESSAVVNAWMASPSHRDNILNPKFKDIGIAVLDGNLNGYNTTLVVQMLATPRPQLVARVSPEVVPPADQSVFSSREVTESIPTLSVSPTPASFISSSTPDFLLTSKRGFSRPPLVDPFAIIKGVSVSLVFLLLGVFAVDVALVASGRVVRVGSHSLAHAAMLGILLLAILYTNVGVIV